MIPNKEVLDLVKPVTKHFEGLRLVPYRDPGGLWTVGWGHRCYENQVPITEEEAEQLLNEDLLKAYAQLIEKSPALISEKPGPAATVGQLACLVDFVFNLGIQQYSTSHLRLLVESESKDSGCCKDLDVAYQLRRWKYDDGKILDGLVARREAEVALWNL